MEKYVYTPNFAFWTSYTNQLGSNVVNVAYDALQRKTNEIQVGICTNRFTYDAAGNLTTLTDGRTNVTTWSYDAEGRVSIKKDANNINLFTYTYFPTGWLSNRLDALTNNTKYLYDPVGNLTNIDYTSSTDIRLAYDALNRLTNMVDATGSATGYTYTRGNLIASEDGPWSNDTVSYTYNNRLRSALTLAQPNASSWTQTYGYDAARRLQTLSSPAGGFTYLYKGPGNLVTNLALPNGSAITNAFDSVARLTGTWLKNSGGTILNSHKYVYNLAGQRTAVTNFFTNYVSYTYDNVGQLKTALGKESGGASRLHEQFGYAYDAAGNLNYRTNNLLVQTFGANNLNELTNVTRTGTLTVAGTTTSTATNVTVNTTNAATLYSDLTFAATNCALTNGNNPFTAIAQDSYNRKDTNSITLNLPATVTYIYDLNGNLTSDGTRGFVYDDENQLIRVTVTNSWKSEFTYDGRMRRRIRKEFAWQNSNWALLSETHYIYDDMLVIQERDVNNLPTVTYTRGRDLSSSLEGAGGIGGLLARTSNSDLPSANAHALYHADGNGNITAIINAQQLVLGRYIYDPFGNILSKSGPLADANTYRFSSKDYHANSGLYYYGYRFYDPNLQRLPNRDPIEEKGGFNLYVFVKNGSLNNIDPFGLEVEPGHKPHWTPDDQAALERIVKDCKCYGDAKETDCAIVCTAFAQGGFILGSAAYLMCVDNCESCGKTWLGRALGWAKQSTPPKKVPPKTIPPKQKPPPQTKAALEDGSPWMSWP